VVKSDGDDKIFGDNGNDWIVGGTGRDDVYGGWGDDLLNVDDDQRTTGGTNDAPDTHPDYEDRAFGGAGRDVLIANTGGDRLIDWAGEFNSYIVPFAPFGMGTVSRTLQPQLAEFLYAVSASDGADFTRAQTGSDPLRNGEPAGELGLIRQQDFAWQDQTGGPRDPQAGNLGPAASATCCAVPRSTTRRSRSAASPPTAAPGPFPAGVLQVSATSPIADAVSVFQIGDALPVYFEMQASDHGREAGGGWKANSYLIFDYINKTTSSSPASTFPPTSW
jgi:Ca2+-binding RTX toxin-like protein